MKAITVYLTLLAGLAGAFTASAQSYSIGWYKIASGGGTSTNSQFTLTGTIGQPDASATMTSGSFALTGGFWSIYAVQTPGTPVLSISFSHNQAIVSWPATANLYGLQTNTDLAHGTWGDYTGTVVNRTVTNDPVTGNLFFRLKIIGD